MKFIIGDKRREARGYFDAPICGMVGAMHSAYVYDTDKLRISTYGPRVELTHNDDSHPDTCFDRDMCVIIPVGGLKYYEHI